VSEEGRKYVEGEVEEMTIEDSLILLRLLKPERRLEIFAEFCASCGCDDPKCCCGRDE
jgi:hypothetical protein